MFLYFLLAPIQNVKRGLSQNSDWKPVSAIITVSLSSPSVLSVFACDMKRSCVHREPSLGSWLGGKNVWKHSCNLRYYFFTFMVALIKANTFFSKRLQNCGTSYGQHSSSPLSQHLKAISHVNICYVRNCLRNDNSVCNWKLWHWLWLQSCVSCFRYILKGSSAIVMSTELSSAYKCLIQIDHILLQTAMAAHRSQYVWFRKLYMNFSRYAVINTFKEIEILDLELDLELDDWVGIQCTKGQTALPICFSIFPSIG